jgi:hypothetical protein
MVSPFFSSQIFVGTFFRVAFEKEEICLTQSSHSSYSLNQQNVCTFLYKIAPIESCAYFLIPRQTKSWSAKFPPKNIGITLLGPCSIGICQDPKGPFLGGGCVGVDRIIIYLLGSVHRANIKFCGFHGFRVS